MVAASGVSEVASTSLLKLQNVLYGLIPPRSSSLQTPLAAFRSANARWETSKEEERPSSFFFSVGDDGGIYSLKRQTKRKKEEEEIESGRRRRRPQFEDSNLKQ